ncbi:MAG: bifunctional DNA primase/polymerase [Caldisericia bacterium]
MSSISLFEDFSNNPKRDAFLTQYIEKGFSIIPVAENKIPYVSWVIYQKRHPTIEEILEWHFKYPNFNIGIVTGKISNFYSLDFDSEDSFLAFPDEYKNSCLTKTKRGYHLNFVSQKSFSSTKIKINNFEVEFKGNGQYVIEPYSKIEGFEYQVLIPLQQIQKIPTFIEKMLEEKKNASPNWNWRYRGEASCIAQILHRNLKIGEREISLYILYNLLIRNKNDTEYAQELVMRKNQTLQNPLPVKEIQNIFRQKIYDKMGCFYIKNSLSFIQCNGCIKNKKEEKMFQEVYLNKNISEIDKKVFYCLKILEIESKKQIAQKLGISRVQVYTSLKKLQEKGLL